MSLALDTVYKVAGRAVLSLERQDIEFRNVTPDQVAIALTLTNEHETPTEPTLVTVEAAPLGVFVRWRPLARVLIPEVVAGGSHRARLIVPRPCPKPLGRHPGDIPPARLLTALDMEEPPRNLRIQTDPRTMAFRTGALPADPFELLGHRNPHWAGNLNVFVGDRAVERHLGRALRIYPGRVNLAFFIVGSSRDAYAFELTGKGAHWDAALFNPLGHRRLGTLVPNLSRCDPLSNREWIDIEQRAPLLLAIRPPNNCDTGDIAVHVTQRSSGRTAVVEFSLDPHAAGPGCFVVK
ncbi:MAG TPA: hypothetical protein VG826_21405 [Pirellulales bacterium]|nr:hypothetical protein [Pirellulales bacterium]